MEVFFANLKKIHFQFIFFFQAKRNLFIQIEIPFLFKITYELMNMKNTFL